MNCPLCMICSFCSYRYFYVFIVYPIFILCIVKCYNIFLTFERLMCWNPGIVWRNEICFSRLTSWVISNASLNWRGEMTAITGRSDWSVYSKISLYPSRYCFFGRIKQPWLIHVPCFNGYSAASVENLVISSNSFLTSYSCVFSKKFGTES